MPKKISGTGKHIHYHKNGSIWAKGQFVRGKMNGHWVWFRKDGSKMRSGYFKMEKQVGKWTTYDKGGKIVKVTSFDT
jgi:antitoxin component YwqK of YwqJK toxin-antitoxin module